MSIIYNGTTVKSVIKDGVELDTVKYGNVEVFSKVQDLLLYRGTARGACDGYLGTATAKVNNSGTHYTSVTTSYITGTTTTTWASISTLLYFSGKTLTKAQLSSYKKIRLYLNIQNTSHNEVYVFALTPAAISKSWKEENAGRICYKLDNQIRGTNGYVEYSFNIDSYLTTDIYYIGVNCKMKNDYIYEIWLTN